MAILLDETTRAEYLAQGVASTRASLVVSALSGTVVVEVFDGLNVLRASGTMAAPWATSSGSTITIGEVTAAGLTVTTGGAPTADWYCQFRAGSRFVRGTFGVAGSGRDFTWSLASFDTGSRGTIGTATLTAEGTAIGGGGGPSVVVTTFQVASATTGTLPWTFGHVFKRGDVPAGSAVVTTDSMDFQAVPTTYWPDGSVRHAIIAGRSTFAAPGTATVNIARGTDPGGVALGIGDLKVAMPASTSVSVGGTTMTLAGTFLDSPHRTVCAGPVMSNWIYRLPVAGSNHLVIWCDVRLYKGSAVELFPWVENGYLLVTGPATVTGVACSVTVGGASRFSQTIDIAHHTRVPLLSGSNLSHWTSDPQITPKHDTTYLRSTKLVPNYGTGAPATATLDALQQTYTPNTLAGVNSAMGSAGGSGAVVGWYGLPAQPLYCTTGDARAYRATVVFGLSAGSWSTHYRDETTNEPLRFDQHATRSFESANVPVGTGATNGTFAITHMPSFSYLPWLITGRWWFLDEQLFATTYCYLSARPNSRRGESSYETAPFLNAAGSAGVIDPRNGTYTPRGAAWAFNAQAQALAITPSTHPCFASLKAAVEANAAFYRAVFVNGTHAPGWVSPTGFLSVYSANGNSLYGGAGASWLAAGWMQGMQVQAWGFASAIGLPVSVQGTSDTAAVAAQAFKFAAGMAGDGSAGNWNWRRIAAYAFPVGSDGTGLPVDSHYTFGQALAALQTEYGLSSIPATPGLPLKLHSSDTDWTTTGTSSFTYGGQIIAGLAMAVDAGVTGAADGWLRVTGSSTWPVLVSEFVNDPAYYVTPRVAVGLPSWLSGRAVMEWTAVPNSTMATAGIAPSPPAAGQVRYVTDAWGGATVREADSHYVVHGGGHGNYAGNEIYTLQLSSNSPQWVRRWGPTPNAQIVTAQPYYLDGNPASTHTYYSLFWDNTNDRLIRTIGSWYLTPSGINAEQTSWNWNASNWNPENFHPDNPSVGYPGGGAAQHPTTGRIYHWNGPRLAVFDPVSNTFIYQTVFASLQRWENAMVVDPARNCVWSFGGYQSVAGTVGRWDIATNALTQPTVTGNGTSILTVNGMGAAWDPVNDCAWIYRGTSILYKFDPNTMTVNVAATTGSTPAAESTYGDVQGTWGRIKYVPALKGLVYTPSWSAPTYFIRTA